jgi:hypothetical protein
MPYEVKVGQYFKITYHSTSLKINNTSGKICFESFYSILSIDGRNVQPAIPLFISDVFIEPVSSKAYSLFLRTKTTRGYATHTH